MELKVIELFAGVGGFRIGLEGYPRRKDSPYRVVWSNQWEPSTKKQHASMVYQARWPECDHSNQDIQKVIQDRFQDIPDHDMLVGGFPCQDYSVATSLRNSQGLVGKKGVLWWAIHGILERKGEKAPSIVLLENVDRLLKSPANQRGRDFAVILSSLNSLGYAAEWRVINAADYGMPQRRRRTFILAYRKGSELFDKLVSTDRKEWVAEQGPLAKAFPHEISTEGPKGTLDADLVKLSSEFNQGRKETPFLRTGVMVNGEFQSWNEEPSHKGDDVILEEILQPSNAVDESFWIEDSELDRWKYLKGAKKEKRFNQRGRFWYQYNEGAMSFPDDPKKASRTIITAEGGRSASRFKHVVYQDGRYRRLTPVELERLNMFPDDHTKLTGITDAKRAFFMGNALVVGVVRRISQALLESVKD